MTPEMARAIDFARTWGVETRPTEGLGEVEALNQMRALGGSDWGGVGCIVGCTFGRLPLDTTPLPGTVWFPVTRRDRMTNDGLLEPALHIVPEVVYLHEVAHALVGASEARCTVFERALASRLRWPDRLLDELDDYGADSCLESERELWRATFTTCGWLDASGVLQDIPAYRSLR